MSVTFSIVGAPTVIEEYAPGEFETVPADGFYSLNMSNVNAKDFLEMLGCHKEANELYGSWDCLKVDIVLRRAITILNKISLSKKLQKNTVTSGNFIEFGRSPEYVEDRLVLLIKLLQSAQAHKMDVLFA
jgi:hypothetical protein